VPASIEEEVIMSERPDTKSTALRITNQFRSDGGMAYDLKCEGVRLTLVIAERTRADDPAAWRIEARGSLTADHKATLLEWGAPCDRARVGLVDRHNGAPGVRLGSGRRDAPHRARALRNRRPRV
jgi:hypothetical protein